jgi:dihydroneopterin aldolase
MTAGPPPAGPAESAGTAAPGAVAPDRIAITGLRVHGRHGVLPAERELGQEFVVDAVLWVDTGPAAANDDLSVTVDYAAITRTLAGIVAGEPVHLLETLAHRLVAACLADGRVTRARVTVHKPAAPIPLSFTDIAVTVTRERSA